MGEKVETVLEGMKIRDEFVCPITYEVFRDPAVASDGFTYERSAIDKWLRENSNSPKNGLPMDRVLLPNINMKKLIQDLIHEGGAGLYSRDRDAQGRAVEVRPERVLTMRCLGPAESDWNEQVFTVSSSGCIGGRKVPDNPLERRDFVLFEESTVSRRHFQISMDQAQQAYFVRDLGSSGGCYIRIFKKKELYPGMIIACGKHQFLVSSIDEAPIATNANETRHRLDSDSSLDLMGPECEGMISEAAELQALIAAGQNQHPHGAGGSGSNKTAEEIARRLMQIQARVLRMSASGALGTSMGRSGVLGQPAEAKDGSTVWSQGGSGNSNVSAQEGIVLEGEEGDENSPPRWIEEGSSGSGSFGGLSASHGPSLKYMGRRLKLTCFNPEASPMVGQTFVVGPDGATIGRQPQNDIALSVKISRDGESQKWTSIDSAVSSVHAYITMDSNTGTFYVNDGSPPADCSLVKGAMGDAKPSLNGTWFRLSGPHQESPSFKLTVGMELLIGTIRFQVGEALTITETAVESTAEPKKTAAQTALDNKAASKGGGNTAGVAKSQRDDQKGTK